MIEWSMRMTKSSLEKALEKYRREATKNMRQKIQADKPKKVRIYYQVY